MSLDQADTPAPPPKARRTRKRADTLVEGGSVDLDLDLSVPAPDATAAAGQDDAAPSPAVPKRRAPRKKAVVEASAASGDEAAAAAPAVPLQAPAPTSSAHAGEGPVARAETATQEPGSSEAGGIDQTESAEASANERGVGEGPAETSSSKRNRNRRRGRRGRDRERTGEPGVEPLPLPALPLPDVGEVFAQVLAGEFDAEPAAETLSAEALPHKRVLAPEPEAPKLQKVLAQAGVGSRRDMEQLIVEGRITVNNQAAHVGQRISWGDQLRIDGKPVKVRIAPPPPRVLAYHKPAGEVVTHDDPQQRPTVFRQLPRLAHGKWQSVGRLDINTEGLLLFTNSGELANQLMHPRFGVEREYAVRILGNLDEAAREKLLAGVEIDGQVAGFKSIEDGGGEGANRWVRVVITEGRNREVRKLFEAVGHAVSRLIRIRYGCVVLPRGLRRGVWVDLAEGDVRALRQLARPPRPAPGEPREQREARPPGDPLAPPPAPGSEAERPGRKRRRGRKGGVERNPDAAPRQPRDGPPPMSPPNERQPVDRAATSRARSERAPRGEPGEDGPIPNPLQQTYDKRAIQQARRQTREISDDGPIPNPLQQTYDKRAMQSERQVRDDFGEDGPIPNPLQQTYDKRHVQPQRQFAGQRSGRKGGPGQGGGAPHQPDPMQTAVGYIGADAFLRPAGKGGKGGKRGGPGKRPGGGPGGPGGGSGGRGGPFKGGGRGGKR